MAQIKFIATDKAKVAGIEIVDGQIIFSRDDRVIYLDSDSKRTSFQQIITVANDTQKQLNAIDGCFYYVTDDNLLWHYKDNEWICLNKSEGSISFEDQLPEKGIEEILYVVDNAIYKWSETSQNYTNLSSSLGWEQIKK